MFEKKFDIVVCVGDGIILIYVCVIGFSMFLLRFLLIWKILWLNGLIGLVGLVFGFVV